MARKYAVRSASRENRKAAEARLRDEWYPVLGRLAKIGVTVSSFDPGIVGTYNGQRIELGSAELRLLDL